jgi:phosphoserine phosphatase SerB
MDGTLLNGRTIFRIAQEKGFETTLQKILKNTSTLRYERSKDIAKLLKCMTMHEFLEIFRAIPLHKNATDVVSTLRKRGIKTALVTDSYNLAAEDLKSRLGLDYAFSNNLFISDGHITGELMIHNAAPHPRFNGCEVHSICKRNVLISLREKLGLNQSEVIAVGDSDVDICMLKNAGLGIAFNAPKRVRENADISITNLKDILRYIGDADGH